MNHKLLALYGLKFNPFSPELPVDAIYVPPKIESFQRGCTAVTGRCAFSKKSSLVLAVFGFSANWATIP